MLSAPSELAQRALDAAPDAMIIIDSLGCIQFVNQQVSALFGYARDELVGQPIELVMPERFQKRHVAHRVSYTSNVRVRPMGDGLDLFGRRKNGAEFPVEISLSPIEDGDRVLVAAAIRDVTDRKRVETELNVARESADRANQGKSRFLATASHDLRQPLQTLALLNGTLRRMVTDPDVGAAVAQQEQAIDAMSRLLNALLDISKLESGAIKPEPTDFTVASVFDELRREFAGPATNKGLALRIEPCMDCVHSDKSLVEQVLRNLISNAIKYTREGCVRLRCLHDAAWVRVEVLDTGIGIPTDQIAYIFDEFYQVGVPTNSSRDGYGLGLSIVQRVVRLLNLKLDVRSELGKGSVFSLVLPAGSVPVVSADSESAARAHRVSHTRQVRIFLVEDDQSVRDATRMLLKVAGYHVTAVASLSEALQNARAGQAIDLLVSDYHLSNGETGTQVIEALREMLGKELRAVLITGDTSSAIKELPRDPHLRITAKPVRADELVNLLEELLAG